MDSKEIERIKETVIASIVANQVAADLLHEIKFTNFYKHQLKQKLNSVRSELDKEFKKNFDKFAQSNEFGESIDIIYNNLYDLISNISKLDIMDWHDINELIKQFINERKK